MINTLHKYEMKVVIIRALKTTVFKRQKETVQNPSHNTCDTWITCSLRVCININSKSWWLYSRSIV